MDPLVKMAVKARANARRESTNSRKHRLKKRAEGICGYNGCRVVTGTEVYYCPLHKEKVRQSVMTWRRANDNDGT
jgi:hypothetical protein